jgi:ribonuclease P protein component
VKEAVTVKENYEFRRMYRKGISAASPSLVLYCRKNRRGVSRLGVTVSKKLGHAVVRNRVRRRIREIFRMHKAELAPGYDCIVVGRVRAVSSSYQEMDAQFCMLAEKLSLMAKKS